MKRLLRLSGLAIALLPMLLASCAKPEYPAPLHAIDITWQHPEPDFHLVDSGGKPRSLADYRGKVAVVFFGYTHCPEVCPTTLADLAQAMRQLGPDAKEVQVIFITRYPAGSGEVRPILRCFVHRPIR
jgi:protein SCO1/2